MTDDKYTALWVSYSSIRDFLKCPRSYFLNNIYRDPKSGHKISLMSPPLALGQAVHEVIEDLSIIPTKERFAESLVQKLDKSWKKIEGENGGFKDSGHESKYKERGREMLRRVQENPGPLSKLAIKIKDDLPHFWLSKEDGIILCGKIDWLEYLKDSNSVHIIDFKTSKAPESPDSLQLPIYHLLVKNCQGREVSKASYWYLERNNSPIEMPLPDPNDSHEKVLEIAKKIKLAKILNKLQCKHKGCYACRPLEAVIQGNAKFIGTDEYKRDVYIKPELSDNERRRSEIL